MLSENKAMKSMCGILTNHYERESSDIANGSWTSLAGAAKYWLLSLILFSLLIAAPPFASPFLYSPGPSLLQMFTAAAVKPWPTSLRSLPKPDNKTYVCAYNTEELKRNGLFKVDWGDRSKSIAKACVSRTISEPRDAIIIACLVRSWQLGGVILGIKCIKGMWGEANERAFDITPAEEALEKCNTYCRERYEKGGTPGEHCKEISIKELSLSQTLAAVWLIIRH